MTSGQFPPSIFDKVPTSVLTRHRRNAFVYGRPSNITAHAVPIPTTRDADPGESLDVFIASCRLACILDTLLPVLGSDSVVEVDHRTLVREAAKQMEDLERETTLRSHEPGSCEFTSIAVVYTPWTCSALTADLDQAHTGSTTSEYRCSFVG